MISLSTPLRQIKGIPPRFLKNLEKLKISTAKDLLWHFPTRYEDFSEIVPIAELEPGQQVTVQGVVEDVKMRRSFRRHLAITEAMIRDDSGTIRATWFNQPYLVNVLRPGRLANFSGKVSIGENEIYLSHPAYELITGRKTEMNHTGRLVPVYPETRGLTSRGIRFLVQPILKSVGDIPEWLPEETLEKTGLPEINDALRDIHFPETEESALLAKKRFAFEDLFLLQVMNIRHKLSLAEEKAPAIKIDVEELKNIVESLPFELTLPQKKSLWEIIGDMGKASPMNRLLQGDVGSGKTVVAAVAALVAANDGFQGAFMAPTEILARQHFQTLKKIFAGLPLKKQPEIGLLTSKSAVVFYENDLENEIKKEGFIKEVMSGKIKIVVGTHSLIQKDVRFDNIALVIIDEQHRFGVRQRAELQKSRGDKFIPHLLSMSATPIPRTLMMTVFGDLDLSLISELPAGRKNIVTKIVAPENRNKAYGFIKEQIKKGRQAFVICPRIEASQENENGAQRKSLALWEVRSVKEEYEKLSGKIFPDLRVGMLHGQMKSKDKEKTMSDFKNKKIDILVSTSVIEVGVDVPNATIMMIEGADRFGLAQLYQFRGRVGRGEHQSFCFLFTDSPAKAVNDRLKAIIDAKNGFELAEKDLRLRGPGEFIGQKQTGLPDVAMRGLQDFELIKTSREAAAEILARDKGLRKYPLLAERLAEFEKGIHLE